MKDGFMNYRNGQRTLLIITPKLEFLVMTEAYYDICLPHLAKTFQISLKILHWLFVVHTNFGPCFTFYWLLLKSSKQGDLLITVHCCVNLP